MCKYVKIHNTSRFWLTLPHARQWWRRLVKVNLTSHCMQRGALASGNQTGATLPSSVTATLTLQLIGGDAMGTGCCSGWLWTLWRSSTINGRITL